MGDMTPRRFLRPAALLTLLAGLAALLPGLASAQIVELGQTKTPVAAPACVPGTPLADCKIVLTRTTAVQTLSDGVINPTRVNQQGWLVSFSVGLSNLVANKKQRASLIASQNAQRGGPPELQLSVLRPGPDNSFTVVGESPVYTLTPFLGQLLQEPLSAAPSFSTFTALHVERGEVIGLTVPTWAPVLAYYVSKSQFGYRQSRRLNCTKTAADQTAQTRSGASTTYGCYYTGTRVEYSATEVTDTVAPKTYVGDTARR